MRRGGSFRNPATPALEAPVDSDPRGWAASESRTTARTRRRSTCHAFAPASPKARAQDRAAGSSSAPLGGGRLREILGRRPRANRGPSPAACDEHAEHVSVLATRTDERAAAGAEAAAVALWRHAVEPVARPGEPPWPGRARRLRMPGAFPHPPAPWPRPSSPPKRPDLPRHPATAPWRARCASKAQSGLAAQRTSTPKPLWRQARRRVWSTRGRPNLRSRPATRGEEHSCPDGFEVALPFFRYIFVEPSVGSGRRHSKYDS